MALCGSNSGPTSTTTNTTSGAPAWFQNALQGIQGRADAVSQTPYQPYGGARVAGFNQDNQDAFSQVRGNVGNWQPALSLGQAGAANAMGGWGSLDQAGRASYEDPYNKDVTQRAVQETVRQDDVNRQSRDASAVGAGSFGGYRQLINEGEANRNLGQTVADINLRGASEGYNNAQKAYQTDVTNQLKGAQTLGSLGQMQSALGSQDAASLNAIGTQQQGLTQENYNTAYGDFLEQRNYPQSQLGWYGGLMTGTPQSAFGSTTTTQAQQPPANGLGQLAGLGLTAAGLYSSGMLGKWWKDGGRVSRYAGGGPVSLGQMRVKALARGNPSEAKVYGGLMRLGKGHFDEGGQVPDIVDHYDRREYAPAQMYDGDWRGEDDAGIQFREDMGDSNVTPRHRLRGDHENNRTLTNERHQDQRGREGRPWHRLYAMASGGPIEHFDEGDSVDGLSALSQYAVPQTPPVPPPPRMSQPWAWGYGANPLVQPPEPFSDAYLRNLPLPQLRRMRAQAAAERNGEMVQRIDNAMRQGSPGNPEAGLMPQSLPYNRSTADQPPSMAAMQRWNSFQGRTVGNPEDGMVPQDVPSANPMASRVPPSDIQNPARGHGPLEPMASIPGGFQDRGSQMRRDAGSLVRRGVDAVTGLYRDADQRYRADVGRPLNTDYLTMPADLYGAQQSLASVQDFSRPSIPDERPPVAPTPTPSSGGDGDWSTAQGSGSTTFSPPPVSLGSSGARSPGASAGRSPGTGPRGAGTVTATVSQDPSFLPSADGHEQQHGSSSTVKAGAKALQDSAEHSSRIGNALLYAGLAMMENASRPGATFLGSLGAGGTEAFQQHNRQQQLDTQDAYRRSQERNMEAQRDLQQQGLTQQGDLQREHMSWQSGESALNRQNQLAVAGMYRGAGADAPARAAAQFESMYRRANPGATDQQIAQAWLASQRSEMQQARLEAAQEGRTFAGATREWNANLATNPPPGPPGSPEYNQAYEAFLRARGFSPQGQPIGAQQAPARPPGMSNEQLIAQAQESIRTHPQAEAAIRQRLLAWGITLP